MYKYVFVLFLLVSGRVRAQVDTTGVLVTKDPRIDLLVKKQIAINEETTRESRQHVPGFVSR